MPRYFFDLEDNGSLASDEEGFEYRDLALAEAEAVKTLAEIARDALPFRHRRTLAIKVRDRSKRLLLRVKFDVNVFVKTRKQEKPVLI